MKTLDTPGADLDRTSSIPGILFTALSMILVTLESTTSGLAPGKIVVTEINEKSISGERSIEIRLADIKPKRTITKLIIIAKTKRLTDTSGKLISIHYFYDGRVSEKASAVFDDFIIERDTL